MGRVTRQVRLMDPIPRPLRSGSPPRPLASGTGYRQGHQAFHFIEVKRFEALLRHHQTAWPWDWREETVMFVSVVRSVMQFSVSAIDD